MLWLSILIIFLVIIGVILFFSPLICQVSLEINEEINLEITCKLGFIPVYSREYRFLITDFFDDYIQPFLLKKKNKSPKFSKKIKLKQLNWNSTIGLEHANQTAISVSLLMTLKSIVMRALSSYFNQPQDIHYQVNPNYNQYGFETYCQCMFSIKLGQAIYMKFKR
ncbi:DUF2953 domain-containing protein [Amphibacillus sp. Q70]|uniref:DUF2953 domain-containing protein n=1 Tax=Amphibacillus sp. Q70 TaxID=3453416 RepID=UPI003F85C554